MTRATTVSKGSINSRAAATYSATTAANAYVTYIGQYKDAAAIEMDRSGIPASIILAQGMLESGAGQSELAKEANNHFGVKCSGTWTGKTYYKKDDDYKNGTLTESCFRKYNSVAESYYDHAEFLRDPRKSNRYGFLFNLDRTDYKGWAYGLQSSGYATSSVYANQLIDLIERYRLYEYDRPGNVAVVPGATTSPGAPVVTPGPGGGTVVAPVPLSSRIGRVNDVKVVLSRDGQTLEDIANSFLISPDKVADYNDRGYSPGVRLRPGTRIYIQPKKDKWHGSASEHFVRDNQSLFDVSQIYGIKLDKLRERNGLLAGQEPAVGEKILLKGSLKKGAVVRLRDVPTNPQQQPDQTTTTTTQPDQPVAPAPKKMTTGEDLPFVIGDDPKPATTTPATQPATPATPATTGTPYPPVDPAPVQQQTQTTTKPANPPSWQNNPDTSHTTPDTPQVGPGYHMVVKGDTLYNIAKRYGLTVAVLKQKNNLPDDSIKIGQTLKIN
jgi:LysM repeat protein